MKALKEEKWSHQRISSPEPASQNKPSSPPPWKQKEKYINGRFIYIAMPSPSQKEIERPEFEALFQLIKDWDINVPDYYTGYSSGNGSHVKLILDAIKQPMRDEK